MTRKICIAVFFGGRSSEHEISLLSASNVIEALNLNHYEIIPIFVSRVGSWHFVELSGDLRRDVENCQAQRLGFIPGSPTRFFRLTSDNSLNFLPPIDVIFPVLHGMFGEDGTFQGMAAIAGIAYVGCGVLSSAIGMDKDTAKALLREAGIDVARSVTLHRNDPNPGYEELSKQLGQTLFIKPARQGSSVGVGCAKDSISFEKALNEAFLHDDKILIEEFVRGREIECAVLEDADGGITISTAGEIIPDARHGFYSYDAKYVDSDGAQVVIPARVSNEIATQLPELTAKVFETLRCEGMARIDYFLREDGRLIVNEINTIPGFTNISLYPKALEISGVSKGQLVDRLVSHALARIHRQQMPPRA